MNFHFLAVTHSDIRLRQDVFESGIEPKVVQSYLGHATLKMTMDLYTHVTPEKSFADIEKIVGTDNKIIEYRRKCV